MYLDFDDYTELGGNMNAAQFERLAAKATALLDRATHGRIAEEKTVRASVKFCMFDLVGVLRNADGGDGREIASMSNDGVSVSYVTGGGISAGCNAIIRQWLSGETDSKGTNLLYAGVDA